MDVFAFRNELVAESERFSRSFTTTRAEDIHQAVDEAYTGGCFWPAPLIQLNPTSYGLPPAAPLPTRPSSLCSPIAPAKSASAGSGCSDLMILAVAERSGAQPLCTFDKKAARLEGVSLL